VPILLVLNYLVAISCAVHAVRTGRQMYWLMILMMVPALGSIIYIIAEVMPEVAGSRGARQAGQAARRAVDPGRDVRTALHELEVSRTPANLKNAADAFTAIGREDQALELYQEATAGAFGDDPAMLSGRAHAEFAVGDAAAVLISLDALRAAQPNVRAPEEHLLYARAHEALGQIDEAVREYKAVSAYFPGAEALARLALCLENNDRADEANEHWKNIVAGARIAPKFARKIQKRWIDMAHSHVR